MNPDQDGSPPSPTQAAAFEVDRSQITLKGQQKHFAYPRQLSESRRDLLRYLKSTLEQLNLFDAGVSNLSLTYRYGNQERSEQSTNVTPTRENRTLNPQEFYPAGDEKKFYPSDVASLVLDIQSILQTIENNSGESSSYSEFTTDLLNQEADFWVKNQNGDPIGFTEIEFYTAYRTRIHRQIDQLLAIINSKPGISESSQIEYSKLEEVLTEPGSSELVDYLERTLIPLVVAVTETPLQADDPTGVACETVTFNDRALKLKEVLSFINDRVRDLNWSLTKNRPENKKIVQLATRLQTDAFVSKSNLLTDLKNLAQDPNQLKFIKLQTSGGISVEFNEYAETTNVFPGDERMSQSTQDLAKRLLALLQSFLKLTTVDFKVPAPDTEADDDDSGDSDAEETPQEPAKLVTEQVILQTIVEAIAKQVLSHSTVQQLKNNWLAQPENTELNVKFFEDFLFDGISRVVTQKIQSEDEYQELILAKSTAKSRFDEDPYHLFDRETGFFIQGPAFYTWLSELLTDLVPKYVADFVDEAILLALLSDFKALQNFGETPVQEDTPSETQTDLATAGTPEAELLDRLVAEYFQGKTPADLSQLYQQDPQRFVREVSTSRLSAGLSARIEWIVSQQLASQGLELPPELRVGIHDDFQNYLLGLNLTADEVILALHDQTRRTQLLAEFNRKFLLQQLPSAKLTAKYVAYALGEKHVETVTKLTEQLQQLASTGGGGEVNELQQKLQAYLLANGYDPDSDEAKTFFANLSQKQLEVVFGVTFQNELSAEELSSFNRFIKQYTDNFHYQQLFEKEITLTDYLEKQLEGQKPVDLNAQTGAAGKILTTLSSLTDGSTPTLTAAELNRNIAVFLNTPGISENINPEDIQGSLLQLLTLEEMSFLLGLNTGQLAQLNAGLLQSLLAEYIATYSGRRILERKTFNHLQDKTVVSNGIMPAPENLDPDSDEAKAYGQSLDLLAQDTPPSAFQSAFGRKSLAEIQRELKIQMAIQEYEEAMFAFQQSLAAQDKTGIDGNFTYLPPAWMYDLSPEEFELYSGRGLTDGAFNNTAFPPGTKAADVLQSQIASGQAGIPTENVGSKKRLGKLRESLNPLKRKRQKKEKSASSPLDKLVKAGKDRLVKWGIMAALNALWSMLVALFNMIITAIVAISSAIVGLVAALITTIGLPLTIAAGVTAGVLQIAGVDIIGTVAKGVSWLVKGVAGIGKGIWEFVSGAWNSLFSSSGFVAGSGTVIIVTGSLVVFTGWTWNEMLQQQRYLLPTIDSNNEISRYVTLEKQANVPNQIDNAFTGDITYSIKISAKDGYQVSVNNIIDSLSVTVSSESENQVDFPDVERRADDLGIPDGSIPLDEPLEFEYTQTFPTLTDANISNVISVDLEVIDLETGEVITDSAKTAEILCIGECPMSAEGCWPTSGYITQMPLNQIPFSRPELNINGKPSHIDADAIDIAEGANKEVFAPFAGTLSQMPKTTNFWEYWGKWHLVLEADNGFKYGFAHLNGIAENLTVNGRSDGDLKVGARVEVGDLLGYVGNQGFSRSINGKGDGSHLHFEMANPDNGSFSDTNYAERQESILLTQMPGDKDGNPVTLGGYVRSFCSASQ